MCIEIKHLTDFESPPRPPHITSTRLFLFLLHILILLFLCLLLHVGALSLNSSHALISIIVLIGKDPGGR